MLLSQTNHIWGCLGRRGCRCLGRCGRVFEGDTRARSLVGRLTELSVSGRYDRWAPPWRAN